MTVSPVNLLRKLYESSTCSVQPRMCCGAPFLPKQRQLSPEITLGHRKKYCRELMKRNRWGHIYRRMGIVAFLSFFGQNAIALDCGNENSMAKVTECAVADQKKVDAELNTRYQQVLASVQSTVAGLPPEETRKDKDVSRTLISAQKAWEKFREADCRARYARNVERTIAPVIRINCMRDHAMQRMKDLEVYEQY